MSNDRVFVRCKKCGKQKLLVKYWGNHFTTWTDDDLGIFFEEHIFVCNEYRGIDLPKGANLGMELITEGDLISEP